MPGIISVHSFRRGTGKSTVAANVAALLALSGQRVGLIDLDVAAPSAHLFFGLDKVSMGCTVTDYLLGKCRLEQAAFDVTQRLRAVAPGCLYVIPASDRAGDIASVMRRSYDMDRLNDDLERLRTALSLDLLLIDTRAGLDDGSLLTFGISDALVVVLRPDRHDFQGTAVVLDLARRLTVPYVGLVVNQVPPSFDLRATKAETEQSYQCQVAAALPYSGELASMASAGLFTLSYPAHPLTRLLKQLAATVGHT